MVATLIVIASRAVYFSEKDNASEPKLVLHIHFVIEFENEHMMDIFCSCVAAHVHCTYSTLKLSPCSLLMD